MTRRSEGVPSAAAQFEDGEAHEEKVHKEVEDDVARVLGTDLLAEAELNRNVNRVVLRKRREAHTLYIRTSTGQ